MIGMRHPQGLLGGCTALFPDLGNGYKSVHLIMTH